MTNNEPLFSDVTIRRSRLPLRVILLAVVLHLPVLMLPGVQKPVATPTLEVALEFSPAPEVVAPEPQTAQPVTPLAPTEPVVLDEKAIPGEQIVVEAMPPNDIDDRPEISPVPDQSAETTPLPTLSRAQLLDAITRMEWDRSPAQTDQDSGQPPELARSTSSATLEALYRPLIAMQANEFDGMTAPSSVEVVDRWLEPGGAHRVVFRSPDGNTYCGRQEAVDDFRPWLQMPMMVHRCGGGGKRSGKQGWRNN